MSRMTRSLGMLFLKYLFCSATVYYDVSKYVTLVVQYASVIVCWCVGEQPVQVVCCKTHLEPFVEIKAAPKSLLTNFEASSKLIK